MTLTIGQTNGGSLSRTRNTSHKLSYRSTWLPNRGIIATGFQTPGAGLAGGLE
jgi:hypothetical protein